MKKIYFWLGGLIGTLHASAQDNLYNPISDHGIATTFSVTPSRNIYKNSNTRDSADGKMGYKSIDLAATFVLYKKNSASGKYFNLSVSPFYNYQRMDLGWLLNPQHIIRTGVRSMALYMTKPGNFWLFNGGVFASNDDYTIYHPTLRYQLTAVYHRKSSVKFAWSGGLLYNYNFGRGLWIPMLNADFTLSQGKHLKVGFPGGLQYIYYKRPGTYQALSLGPRGQVATLTNQFGEFASNDLQVQWRMREWALAWRSVQPAGNRGRWFIDLALLGGRRMYVSDGIGLQLRNFQSGFVAAALAFKVGYAVNLPNKKKAANPISEQEMEDLLY